MKKLKTYPGWKISSGDPARMGAHKVGKGYSFTVQIADEEEASLLLFKKENPKEVYRVPLPVSERIGEIRSVRIEPLDARQWYYGYESGHKYFLDPYACEIAQMSGQGKPYLIPHDMTKGCIIPKTPVLTTKPPRIPYEDSIIYKTNVRGFTMSRGSNTKDGGTFSGVINKIPYLKELGITALELMPVYEFYDILDFDLLHIRDEKQRKTVDLDQMKRNYWGYGPALYYAPKALYGLPGHTRTDLVSQFADLVDALHKEKMECILEFFFTPDIRPEVVLDILHYWTLTFGVDGFHLMGDHILANHIAADPLLRDTKLIYTGFDTAAIYGENVKPSFKNLAEHNLSFEHLMRKFLKGDDGCAESAAYKLRRNPTGCGQINYFADHDGFTMADMVMYEQKHNESNGENNRDGTDLNYTWNCGMEGPASNKKICSLRRQQMRNAWLILMTAQGTPLIYGGDENCNSASGNNNPYCQDNAIGWQDWNRKKDTLAMRKFVKNCIQFRKSHPVLHQSEEPRLTDYKSLGYPDLSYHGDEAWFPQMEYNSKTLGILYYGAYGTKRDDVKDESVYIALNMSSSEQKLALPDLSEKEVWKIAADTSMKDGFYPPGKEQEVSGIRKITVPPRTVMVLISGQTKKQGGH